MTRVILLSDVQQQQLVKVTVDGSPRLGSLLCPAWRKVQMKYSSAQVHGTYLDSQSRTEAGGWRRDPWMTPRANMGPMRLARPGTSAGVLDGHFTHLQTRSMTALETLSPALLTS